MIKSRLVSLLAVCSIVATVMAADPANKPDAAKKPDAAATVVENPTYHFKYSIPKTWKVKQKSPKTTVYELAGQSGNSNGGILVVLAAAPKKADAKLSDIVDGKKKVLEDRIAKTKYATDEATTLDGAPAWHLVYDLPATARETTTVNGKPAESKDVTILQRSTEIMCLKDGIVVDLVYVGVGENFATYAKMVDQVLASFEWTNGNAAADKK